MTRSGHTYTPEKTRYFESSVRLMARTFYKKPPLEGPLSAEIIFTFKRPKSVSAKKRPDHVVKPDLDNLLKSFFDAVSNGVLFHDDAQIVHISALKQYGDENQIKIMLNEFVRP